MKLFTRITSLVLTVFNLGLFAQTEVTLNPAKDNTLFENASGALSSGAGSHFFAGRLGSNGGGAKRRAVLAFDLAQIPQGASIQTVTLTLNMSKTSSGAANVSLHKLAADWGEGTSNSGTNGQGVTSTTDDATWIHTFFNTSNWINAGGDFEATASASASVAGIGSYTWGSTSEMVADVQNWLDNSAMNFGWVLVGNESTMQTAKRFDSKESSNQPVLTVTFSPPTSVSENSQVPDQFELAQNFPNPFNPSTKIGYAISATESLASVKLDVFNLLGQKIRTLVDAKQAAGSYSIEWDGRSFNGSLVSNGVYIYRLSVAGKVSMKRMTFLK